MPKTTLPNIRRYCPRCESALTMSDGVITCTECDRHMLFPADPETSLTHFTWSEIIDHAREHPPECLCDACRYAREEGDGYYSRPPSTQSTSRAEPRDL